METPTWGRLLLDDCSLTAEPPPGAGEPELSNKGQCDPGELPWPLLVVPMTGLGNSGPEWGLRSPVMSSRDGMASVFSMAWGDIDFFLQKWT